ncbi:MAG: response regulator [Bacillota bacterium]|nr:response regulator [Bacillota bacterium]
MLNGKKVLIVEDSRTMRLQLKMMLKQEGVELVEVGNEWGMFSRIDEYGSVADLIIMDLVLSSENGLDLIRKLKSSTRYASIPIIILTEKADLPTILMAKELGIKDYLRKPIKKAELISRINNALETL